MLGTLLCGYGFAKSQTRTRTNALEAQYRRKAHYSLEAQYLQNVYNNEVVL